MATIDPLAVDREEPGGVEALFQKQKAAFLENPFPGYEERIRNLRTLERLLKENADRIASAVSADFGNRAVQETKLLEIFCGVEGIRHACRHLKSWMAPEKRQVSVWFKPGRARVVRQPVGVVGIIVPWNFPIYLAIGPLTSALAAGNRAVVKMSEFTPRTGALVEGLLRDHFPEDVVAAVNGGADVAAAFSGKPWDHLLFTGSTSVGKLVMRAAADHLTPVTLELGGKSPATVGPDFPIELAARRIMFGKCLNAGQICVAPDYVLLPAGTEDEFAKEAEKAVAKMYPSLKENPDFTSIINDRHFERLQDYLADAALRGARTLSLNPAREVMDGSRKLPPTLLFDVTSQMKVMQDEIFGPILPVVPYRDLDEAIAFINSRPRPLALYYFGYDAAQTEKVVRRTTAGGMSVNETITHVGQDSLPFGGVGPSGMGHYHGKDGFDTFSKQKGIFLQSRVNTLPLLSPPYGRLFDSLMKVMLR